MACRTGAAWGLTETRSGARRCANHSAVMTLTIDADDAWWPPTFTPEGVVRTRFAWCTIDVASHSTRRCSASRTSSEGSVAVSGGAASVLITSALCHPRPPGGDSAGGRLQAEAERPRGLVAGGVAQDHGAGDADDPQALEQRAVGARERHAHRRRPALRHAERAPAQGDDAPAGRGRPGRHCPGGLERQGAGHVLGDGPDLEGHYAAAA